jgi:S1-C subfamily serine protease
MLKHQIFRLVYILLIFSFNNDSFARGIFSKEIKYTLTPVNVRTFREFEKGIINYISKSAFMDKKSNYRGITAFESDNSRDKKLIFTQVEQKDSAEVFISYTIENDSFLNLIISTNSTQYDLSCKIEVTTNGNTFLTEPILKKIKKDFFDYFEKAVVDVIEFRFTNLHNCTNAIEGIWATDDGFKSFIISSKFNSNGKSESFNWISLMPNSLFENIGTIKNSTDGVYQFSYKTISQYDASINTSIPPINKIVILNKLYFEVDKYSYETSNKAIWIKVSNSNSSQSLEVSKEINSIGTAFSIGQNLLATNYHVVDELNSIYIRQPAPNDKLLKCKVVVSDRINDISILEVMDSCFKKFDSLPYNLTTRNVRLGEDVYAFGFPLNKKLGSDIKLTNGSVNSKNGFKGEFTNFQFSANIYPGNSGGPLISKDAEVIGITVSGLVGTEMINYAIKLDYLFYLAKSIDGYNYSNYFDSKKQLTGLPNSAENISKFVFNICGN